MKAIFNTGYDIEAIAKDLALNHGANLLQKPYEPPSLLQMIRKVLDGR